MKPPDGRQRTGREETETTNRESKQKYKKTEAAPPAAIHWQLTAFILAAQTRRGEVEVSLRESFNDTPEGF